MCTRSTFLTAYSLIISTGLWAQSNSIMKSINNDAPVTCIKTIKIHASRETVWEVMTNIDRWADWQTDISTPKLNGELQPESTFDWKTGGARIHSTLHTVEPFHYFGWTGRSFGMLAIHNWTLTETEGMTTVQVEESMEGFLASVFKKMLTHNLEKGMRKTGWTC